MKRKPLFVFLLLAAGLSFLLFASGCFQAQAPIVGQEAKEGQAGTTLTASKTAEDFWEKVITYDWDIKKDGEIKTADDGSKYIEYTITATRKKFSETDRYGVRGTITVTNGGAVATENLKLVDQVEYKTGVGQFQPLEGASQTIQDLQLVSGETGMYNYEIVFTPVSGATYRNVVKVTITNHSGHLGKEFGPEPKADFSLPDSPTITYIDETATITDFFTCPTGFDCKIEYPSLQPWKVGAGNYDDNSEWTITYNLIPKQLEGTVCERVTFENTATLTEDDNGEVRKDTAGIGWSCAILDGGCTYTQGYQKNHPEAQPVGELKLGEKTYAKAELLKILKQPVRGNGLISLAHQLIAAKLNIANGANPSAIADTITAADKLINGLVVPPIGSGYLAPSATGSLTEKLDQYNNGYIGPGHCE